MRGGTRAELITPNDAEVRVAVGWLKFTLLKTLNASARTSIFTRSLTGNTLWSEKSVSKNPGPVKMFRPEPNCATPGKLNCAFSAVERKLTEEPDLSMLPIAVGSPWNRAFMVMPGYRYPRPELTLNG